MFIADSRLQAQSPHGGTAHDTGYGIESEVIPMCCTDNQLFDMARKAMMNAYAPYSKYTVGACLLSEDGRAFVGCNVENASYGLTICAERGAIMAAIAAGARRFTRIAITSQGAMPWPCGACRQVLNEFAPDIEVLVQDGQGNTDRAPLSQLLPHGFGPESL